MHRSRCPGCLCLAVALHGHSETLYADRLELTRTWRREPEVIPFSGIDRVVLRSIHNGLYLEIHAGKRKLRWETKHTGYMGEEVIRCIHDTLIAAEVDIDSLNRMGNGPSRRGRSPSTRKGSLRSQERHVFLAKNHQRKFERCRHNLLICFSLATPGGTSIGAAFIGGIWPGSVLVDVMVGTGIRINPRVNWFPLSREFRCPRRQVCAAATLAVIAAFDRFNDRSVRQRLDSRRT